MKTKHKKGSAYRSGSVLVLVVIVTFLLMLVGASLIRVGEGAADHAVLYKNETVSIMAAEAAYETALAWMAQCQDLYLNMDMTGTSGSVSFGNATADYTVEFYDFVGYRPVYEVTANGYCGTFHRSIRSYLTQAISGWDMGVCRVPSSGSSTSTVTFSSGEIIEMPVHINSYADPHDSDIDIYVTGDPTFLRSVSMGEARYSSGGFDKYKSIINVFDNGIMFNQPKSLITDEDSIQEKIDWYEDCVQDQKPQQYFTPVADSSVTMEQPAIQLEFVVDSNGKGAVRITEDCTVRGYISSSSSWDYKVRPGTDGTRFDLYPIYGYHYIPEDAVDDGKRYFKLISEMQVVPEYGDVDGPPFSLIFVDGNVIIGSASEHASDTGISQLNVVQGKMVVVATGNIWVAGSIVVSDKDDSGKSYARQADGKPGLENPNVLSLISQGVVKVVDPGMSERLANPGGWEWVKSGWSWVKVWVEGGIPDVSGLEYEPIGNKDTGYADYTYHRHLPDPTVVEAAITVGGGGWGAEHVRRTSEERKEASGKTDDLIVRGTLTEVVRGVVGLVDADGYSKNYYFDERLMSGIIPGNTSLKGKFVTVPGGWNDYRVDTKPED